MSETCIYFGDYEAPEVYREKTVRARKEHRCCECAETIAVGDLHERVVGLWDGAWDEYRTCARCVNIRTDFFPDGWEFGSLVQCFRDAHGIDYRDGIPADLAPCRDGAA